MEDILDAISHKLSGQYVRFTTLFGTIFLYSMIWNDFPLQHDLERFCFAA